MNTHFSLDATRLRPLTEMLDKHIDSGATHGASLVVSQGGERIYEYVKGYADKANGRALEAESVFITMSTAKPFTAVLVLKLVEQGLLRLHAPVSEVLPAFQSGGKDKLTLFNLLTHTSGVMMGFPNTTPDVLTNVVKLSDFVATQYLECLPGERVNYSMLAAHSILAAMCLKVAGGGRSYSEMMRDEILQPLGMHTSSLGPREDLVAKVCPLALAPGGESELFDDAALSGLQALICMPGSEMPAAGIFTTRDDLHKFTEMLRAGGAGAGGERIISPAMLAYATQVFTGSMRNHVWDSVMDTRGWQPFSANLGLGFHVRGDGIRPGPFGTLSSAGTFGHLGAGSTGVWVDPGYDLSFTLLSTGLWEDSHHLERTGVISDIVVSSLTHA